MKKPFLIWRPLGLALALCLAHQGVTQAQSSYTLSVLKPPALGGIETMSPNQWAIDPKDQVIGAAQYFGGLKFVPGWGLLFAPTYESYVVSWPATTAASASPVKLLNRVAYVKDVSYKGTQVLGFNGGESFDTVTRKLTTLPDSTKTLENINDAQVMVWNSIGSPSEPGTWRAGQGYQALPYSPYLGAYAGVINNAGSVGGMIVDPVTSRAALWANGQLQVLETTSDIPSKSVMLNDVNQVLVQRYFSSEQFPCPATGACPVRYSLWSNGVSTPLVTTADDGDLEPAVLNNKGEVLGTIQHATGREHAVIWRNGLFSDLTAEVRAKGAKLPAGAVLKQVLAVNDKGSLVAVMRDAKGLFSTVRLTAKP